MSTPATIHQQSATAHLSFDGKDISLPVARGSEGETAVDIEKFEIEGTMRRIAATIYVDKTSHKGIVIGEKGATLKRIGTEARHAMQELFGSRVHLELWVKVKGGWADNEIALRQLGYK